MKIAPIAARASLLFSHSAGRVRPGSDPVATIPTSITPR